jgi:hypothetical protein
MLDLLNHAGFTVQLRSLGARKRMGIDYTPCPVFVLVEDP